MIRVSSRLEIYYCVHNDSNGGQNKVTDWCCFCRRVNGAGRHSLNVSSCRGESVPRFDLDHDNSVLILQWANLSVACLRYGQPNLEIPIILSAQT